MKILITGGAGFIGSHLAEHFQQRATVRVLDNLRTGHRRNLKGQNREVRSAVRPEREGGAAPELYRGLYSR